MQKDRCLHMKKNKPYQFKRNKRVDFQVFFLTALIVIISCGLIFSVNYHLSYSNMIEELKVRANSIHSYLESQLDISTFCELNKIEDEQLESYIESKAMLKSIREVVGVRYLYTAKRADDGTLIYLVDGLPANSPDFRNVGNLIEEECIPDLERALNGEVVLPNNINNTTWGSVFISYFPIHDEDKIVGAVGMEFAADRQYDTFAFMQVLTIIIICSSCLVAAAISVFLFRRISNPSFRDASNTDFLTKIKNRNAFEIDIHNFEHSSILNALSFISIDLDGLKNVNDFWGHAVGDEYIKKASEVLQKCIQKTGILYRIGGDEFVIFIYNKPINEIEALIQNIREEEKSIKSSLEYPFSLSIGFASFDSKQDHSASDTLKRSDMNMYINKKERKQNFK